VKWRRLAWITLYSVYRHITRYTANQNTEKKLYMTTVVTDAFAQAYEKPLPHANVQSITCTHSPQSVEYRNARHSSVRQLHLDVSEIHYILRSKTEEHTVCRSLQINHFCNWKTCLIYTELSLLVAENRPRCVMLP